MRKAEVNLARSFSLHMPWKTVLSESDLPAGTMAPARVGETDIVLCNHNGAIHALQGLCPHRNGPLWQGNFVDGNIVCPWHAWEFRCEDGCFDYNPDIRLQRFAVKIENGEILVEVP